MKKTALESSLSRKADSSQHESIDRTDATERMLSVDNTISKQKRIRRWAFRRKAFPNLHLQSLT